jgi:hypothetical protein
MKYNIENQRIKKSYIGGHKVNLRILLLLLPAYFKDPKEHMDSFFTGTFFSVFQAILKVFLIASVAGFITYKKIFTEEFIDGLSFLVVKVFLPLQMFATIMRSFNQGAQSY